jgi:hypothetical protein
MAPLASGNHSYDSCLIYTEHIHRGWVSLGLIPTHPLDLNTPCALWEESGVPEENWLAPLIGARSIKSPANLSLGISERFCNHAPNFHNYFRLWRRILESGSYNYRLHNLMLRKIKK